MIDAKAFGEDIARLIRARTEPLETRIADLEKRIDTRAEPDPAGITERVMAAVSGEIAELRARIDAMSGTPDLPDFEAMIGDAVSDAVKAIPAPKDGTSVTVGDVLPALKEQVAEYLDALDRPKDGTSVTVDDVMPAIKDYVDAFLEALPAPKDGVGVAGAFIDRGGALTLTLTNGETRNLGPVVGQDGEPGIGFDDMDILHDGGRKFTFRFQRGARIIERAFTVPVMLDRGVYSEGKDYETGDAVSFGGSVWIAQADTQERPGTGDGWRLAVKKGRDGKSAEARTPVKSDPVRVG